MAEAIQKKDWPEGKEFGHIRMSSAELVEQLKEVVTGDMEVTASSDDHQFESLADMEGNLSLLVGQIRVCILDKGSKEDQSYTVFLNFDPCFKVKTFGDISPSGSPFVQKLVGNFTAFRTPLIGRLTHISIFGWLVLTIMVPIVLFQIVENFAPSIGGEIRFILLVSSFCLLFALSVTAIILNQIRPIYYSGKETFWQRNRDKILVGLIMLFVGSSFTFIMTWFLGGNSQ
ncbi:hypothetical protein [Sulfitobacter geojensis]|uniref:hypothetical protein n=1 Tax=Sulfitobacter geojensis TaxID=1342299 RepID=UPI0024900774|nr:hypothetical protein [Sulfitobacter geojensis]